MRIKEYNNKSLWHGTKYVNRFLADDDNLRLLLSFLQKFATMTVTVITTQYLSIILLVTLAITKNVHCQDLQQQQASTFQQVPLTSQQTGGTQQQQITTQQVASVNAETTTAAGILCLS